MRVLSRIILALVFYEYLITFKYQVDFIWRRKWSAATWIFVINQYILLANVISGVIPYNAQVSNPNHVWILFAD